MAVDPRFDAALALHRFGLGPRVGSIAAIASDPRGALVAEIDRPGSATITNPDLQSGGQAARAMFNFQQERRAMRQASGTQRPSRLASAPDTAAPTQVEPNAIPPNTMAADPPAMADANQANTNEKNPNQTNANQAGARPANNPPPVPQQLYLAEVHARIDAALGCDLGFTERWVWFWSNHFCVSADKGPQVRSLSGAFEREAIRRHAFGRFEDMLLAVESHPAMLFYLDNVRSMGAESIAGRNRNAGLNENLAREILELHTLGVRTVYTQDDVTSFAKVITGWSIVPFREDPEHGGEFFFNPRLHEPGSQTVIGKGYPDGGFEQGRAVLADLAHHRATARHIATKLATHFVSDVPPPTLVDRLATRFLATDGNLKEMAKTLLTSKEAWEASRDKLKRPSEWIVGALRATGVTPPDIRPVIQAQNNLGEPLWRPPAPKGFPDEEGAWIDGIGHRLETANAIAQNPANQQRLDPKAMLETALGPLASADTRSAVNRAETKQQAVALLLMAPEFQRR
jgi:uncharacterized protein (DUF1800 family)